MVGIDIVGPCPITENRNEYIIVVVDYYTKWTKAFAVPNHTALTEADKLVTEFFCRFGVCRQYTLTKVVNLNLNFFLQFGRI